MAISLKDKLRRSEVVIGSWLTMAHPAVVEILAETGFQWLAVDMEHGPLGLSECQDMIRLVDLMGVVPLVRVGENNPLLIAQSMDAGACGVIIPRVNTALEATSGVEAVKYPPLGRRGVGLARAQKYGFGFDEYRKWLEEKSIVVPQIEHIKAVENLSGILDVPHIDALFVGPYDISASLGVPGQFEHPSVLEALEEIKRLAKGKQMALGYHVVFPEPQRVKEKMNEGFGFIAYSTDFLLLGNKCREDFDRIQSLLTV